MYTRYQTHPGHIVRMIMKEQGLSNEDVAEITGLDSIAVIGLLTGDWVMMTDCSSWQLSRLQGPSEYWLELWDIWSAYKTEHKERYGKEPPRYYPV